MPKLGQVSKTSENIENENLQKLRQVFPQFVKDGEVDFDALKEFFAKDDSLAEQEKYGLNWAGKSNAFKAIQVPATGTLTPQESESKNWDTTENLFIEGDNLEVLKLLQKHYREKIKMIYIDPPYNTGKDFVYKDNFTEDKSDYYERSGQSKNGIKLTSNPESGGRYHSDWLTMMYPRLFLARNLLRDDGVIFISIDDNEIANLRLIMDEIFGEENFVGQFKWNRVAKAPSLSETIRIKYEYIICYKKGNAGKFFGKKSYNIQGPVWHNPNKQQELLFPARTIKIPESFKKGSKSEKYQVELLDDIIEKDGLNKFPVRIKACSAWGQEKINRYIKDGNLFQIKKDIGTLYASLPQGDDNFIAPADLISKEECGVDNNTDASMELEKLGIPFTNPKPVSLIKYLINMVTHTEASATILDFFAGSGTTAQAVMDLNAEDKGNRKCICVQLPEETEEGSEARKSGFKNIPEIARERIRRAGKKIGKGDIGFKALALEKSNYRQWNILTDKDDPKKLLEQSALFAEKPLMDKFDEKSVVYEILLKEGFDLNSDIVPPAGDKKGLSIWTVLDKGERPQKMHITFAKKVTQEDLAKTGIGETDNEIFVCFDSALDDTTKVNIVRNLNVKVI